MLGPAIPAGRRCVLRVKLKRRATPEARSDSDSDSEARRFLGLLVVILACPSLQWWRSSGGGVWGCEAPATPNSISVNQAGIVIPNTRARGGGLSGSARAGLGMRWVMAAMQARQARQVFRVEKRIGDKWICKRIS
ncbi:hypothetical protein BJ875DRAFT_444529 [Amylocarpus encephaloides]|uniref:Uncharacterized protein n=1 Tax=Amylocarpus encephaloides TaxID=45428 RepID=A0A9P7YBP7_9HELO|nr:hypothetical protein BJ875DRAFT_444529 [Amylocarpus encephaloides]